MEQYLKEEPEEIRCPLCDEVCESIYTDRLGWTALGCNKCLKERDVWDWYEHKVEEEKVR